MQLQDAIASETFVTCLLFEFLSTVVYFVLVCLKKILCGHEISFKMTDIMPFSTVQCAIISALKLIKLVRPALVCSRNKIWKRVANVWCLYFQLQLS